MTRVRALFTRAFWLDAAERAVKSFAQCASAAMGQDLLGADLFAADWKSVAASGLALAVLSILTSVASAPITGISPASMLPPGA